MDHWTLGLLDYWTIGLYFGQFLNHFFWLFFSFRTILSWGGKLLVPRERWDAINKYSGRGGRQIVVTEGGVEDELLVTATD